MEIDLEKYAGHTPGPWRLAKNRHTTTDGRTWGWVTYGDASSVPGVNATWQYGETAHANCRLIADAPALLAEVVRLRADLAEAVQTLEAIEIAARMRFSPADILDENSTIREEMRAVLAKHGGGK